MRGWRAVARLSDLGVRDMRGTFAGSKCWGGIIIVSILDLILGGRGTGNDRRDAGGDAGRAERI